MKKYLIYIFFSFVLLTNNLKSNIQSSIIVKVDTKIITSFEVKNKILSTLIISENEISQENIDNLKRQTLNNLILYKLNCLNISSDWDFSQSIKKPDLCLIIINS